MFDLSTLPDPNHPAALTFLRHNNHQHILGFKNSAAAADWLEKLRDDDATSDEVKEFLHVLFDELRLLPLKVTPSGRISLAVKRQ